jgi:hypothetical protein
VTRLQVGWTKNGVRLPARAVFLSSPLPDRLWSLASLLSSGYRDSWRSVSAGAGSWLLTSDQYFRVLLSRHKENVTFTVYMGLPFYAFVARIACDEHDVSCVVLFHVRNCPTDFGEVLYWGSAIRSGRIYFWLESVQTTPVLYLYLDTLPQTDLQETVVDLSDVKWAIIPIKEHNVGFSTDRVGGGGGYGVAQLVEAVRHKPEGRGFDSHWDFSLT